MRFFAVTLCALRYAIFKGEGDMVCTSWMKIEKMFIDQVRRMVTEKVAPRAADIDKKGEFPWDLKKVFQDMGLMGLSVPEEYGGLCGGISMCAWRSKKSPGPASAPR